TGLAEAALLRVAGAADPGLRGGRLVGRERALLLRGPLRPPGGGRRPAVLDLALEAGLERRTAAERDLQMVRGVRWRLLHPELGVEPDQLLEGDQGQGGHVLDAG